MLKGFVNLAVSDSVIHSETHNSSMSLKLFMSLYTKYSKTHNLLKTGNAKREVIFPGKWEADESSTGVNNQHNYRDRLLSATNW